MSPESCCGHCFLDVMVFEIRKYVHLCLPKYSLKHTACLKKEPEQEDLSHFIKGCLSAPHFLVLNALE